MLQARILWQLQIYEILQQISIQESLLLHYHNILEYICSQQLIWSGLVFCMNASF